MLEPLHLPGVFDEFFDDAAVFPPGRAPLDRAVREHILRRGTPLGSAVGPLLLPVGKLDEAAALVSAAGSGGVRVGVVVPAGGLDAALDAAGRVEPWIRVTGLELKTDDAEPARIIADGAALTGRFDVHVELTVPHIRAGMLERLAGTDVRLKVRTGGLVADAFPTVEELAEMIAAAVVQRRSFKLTAGLHRAVRYTDATTGFPHHGFLNIAVATGNALRGAGTTALAKTLAETDGTVLAQCFRENGDSWREMFESFGTCSIAEPIDTLAELELIPLTDPGRGN